MSSEGSLPDKIQKLLAVLPEASRNALERAVEKARQKGISDPVFDLLDQQFKQSKFSARKYTRPLEPSRLFMRPLEPFLIDARPPQKTSGRIWRGALQGLWIWIERNLAREEVEACRAKLLSSNGNDEHDEIMLVDIEITLRNHILPKLRDELDSANQTPETRRRFAYQVGGESQLQELEDIFILFSNANLIEELKKEFPAAPALTSSADLSEVVKIFTRLASIDPHLPYYAAALLYNKLEQKEQLPLWASACVRSDDLKQIVNSPFASIVEISLGEAALMAEQCIEELTKPSENNQAVYFARTYAITCRNLRAAVDLETQSSDWLRQLSDIRMRISNKLADEFAEMFQLLRRNVRPLRAFRTQTPLPPDNFDLDRLCFLIEMLNTTRAFMQEFALNEVANKIYSECEDYLQIAVDSLLDELRGQPDNHIQLIRAYTQAAIRVTQVWYGEKRAALLQRSFEVAAATSTSQKEAASGS